MPTYDYRCEACGHALEMFQSMSEKPKRKCPECGAPKLQRLIGAGAGFLFKGSGYYLTDYRSDSYKQAAEKDKPSSDSKPAGEAKPASEAKPDTKSAQDAPASPKSDKKLDKKNKKTG